jgi:hypothetical protein
VDDKRKHPPKPATSKLGQSDDHGRGDPIPVPQTEVNPPSRGGFGTQDAKAPRSDSESDTTIRPRRRRQQG